MLDCNYFDKKINVHEAICLMERKINELVEMYNRVNTDHKEISAKIAELEKLVDYLIGAGLEAEVKKQLEKWLADGTLAGIIGSTLDKWTERIVALEERNKAMSYVINYESDFNPNDISITVNRLQPLIKSGDSIILLGGDYSTSTTLNLDYKWLEGVNVDFRGNITLNSQNDISCVFIQGQQLNIKLNSIVGTNQQFTGENYDVLLANGVELGMVFNSIIKVNKIEKFKNGMLLSSNKPGDTTPRGIQYTEIDCRYLFHNHTGYMLKPLFDLSWINENVFRSGKIIGYNGVSMIKQQKPGDSFNNNRFLFLGFEDIQNDAFQLDNSFSTLIVNPRVERVGNRIIRDTALCNRTFMLTLFTAYYGNFTLLGKNTVITGNLLSNIPNSITLSKIITDDNYFIKVYDVNGNQVDVVNKSLEYTLDGNTTDKLVRNGVKIINADNTVKSVGCQVDKVIYNQTGYELLLNVKAFDAGRKVSIYDASYVDLIVPNTFIDSVGVYRIINIGNSKFKIMKISSTPMA